MCVASLVAQPHPAQWIRRGHSAHTPPVTSTCCTGRKIQNQSYREKGRFGIRVRVTGRKEDGKDSRKRPQGPGKATKSRKGKQETPSTKLGQARTCKHKLRPQRNNVVS
eukprot:365345-Chlamydomonas_euryale.AAC.9